MIKKMLLYLFNVYAFFCYSQIGELKVKVYDSIQGDYLYCCVLLQNTKFSAMANDDGVFSFDDVPLGDYVLIIDDGDRISKKEIKLTQEINELEFEIPDCNYFDDSCPICNKKDKVIPILYGLIADKEILSKAKRKKVILGGCLVSNCDSNWYCKRDRRRF